MSKSEATNFEIEKIEEKKTPQTKTDTIFETNKFMNVFKWFIPTLVVFVLLMINYAIKGIAPFGSKYISYVDMEVGYVPVFYSMWDMVRGGGNLFYNFFLGMGSNVYGSLVMNAMFSPLNCSLYLCQEVLYLLSLAGYLLSSYRLWQQQCYILSAKFSKIQILICNFCIV